MRQVHPLQLAIPPARGPPATQPRLQHNAAGDLIATIPNTPIIPKSSWSRMWQRPVKSRNMVLTRTRERAGTDDNILPRPDGRAVCIDHLERVGVTLTPQTENLLA